MKVFVKILSVCVLLFTSSTLCCAQDKKDVSIKSAYLNNPSKAATDYYLRGKEILVSTGDVETACKYFIEAVKSDPNHGPSNYELSRAASPEVGINYILKAYESDTTNYWYQRQLAGTYFSLKNFPKALEMGKLMVKTNSTDDDGYKQLASFYLFNNEVDSAMSVIDTIASRFGNSPDLAAFHCDMIRTLKKPTPEMIKRMQDYANLYSDISQFTLMLGDVYIKLGLSDPAIKSYKRVKEIDADDLRGDIALFDYYNMVGEQSESVKYLSSVFKSPEIDVKAKIALYKDMIATNVYLYRNYFSFVDDASMSLILSYPKDMEVRKLYTEHLLRKGDISSALAFNKTGLEDGYVDYDSFMMIVEIEAYYKHLDSMEHYINKGYDLFPEKKKELNMIKISLYTMREDYESAVGMLKNEIKGEKNDSILGTLYGSMGDIYHTWNKNKLAYKAYEKALNYNPDNVIVLNNYSYYLSLENKELEKALKMAEKVMKMEPSNSTYIDTYGWVLYKLGRYEQARDVMMKAVALDTTKNSSLVLHYGDVLDKLGLRSIAESYWLKALEYGGDEKEVTDRIGENDSRVKVIKEKLKLNNN